MVQRKVPGGLLQRIVVEDPGGYIWNPPPPGSSRCELTQRKHCTAISLIRGYSSDGPWISHESEETASAATAEHAGAR